MDSTAEKAPEKCTVSFNRPTDDTLSILFSGSWKIRTGIPPIDNLQNEIESNPNIKRIVIDTQEITDWDSGLLTFLIKVNDYCSQKNITINTRWTSGRRKTAPGNRHGRSRKGNPWRQSP